jgi:hypothetical protein
MNTTANKSIELVIALAMLGRLFERGPDSTKLLTPRILMFTQP